MALIKFHIIFTLLVLALVVGLAARGAHWAWTRARPASKTMTTKMTRLGRRRRRRWPHSRAHRPGIRLSRHRRRRGRYLTLATSSRNFNVGAHFLCLCRSGSRPRHQQQQQLQLASFRHLQRESARWPFGCHAGPRGRPFRLLMSSSLFVVNNFISPYRRPVRQPRGT